MVHKQIMQSRLAILVVLLTAVLALSTVYADQPVPEDPAPRPQIRAGFPVRPQASFQLSSNRQPTLLIPWAKIVNQSIRDGNWEIYIQRDDGEGLTRLTYNNNIDIQPRLNRGGTRIVFVSSNGSGSDDYEIFVMNADGSALTQLTSNNTNDVNPYWSPDGSRIVFESYRDGQAEIYVMNADGSKQVRLTYEGDFDGYPSWSPDGNKIAFTSRRTGGYRIYSINPDGTGLIQLSDQPYSFNPVWSPDSSQLAFDADGDENGWQDIWLMNADGSNERLLYQLTGNEDASVRSWSPDGAYIGYTQIDYVYQNGNWYVQSGILSYRDVATGSGGWLSTGLIGYDFYPDWQTMDAQAPTTNMIPLPVIAPAPISVQWGGSDTGGSGFRSYQVQVKVGDGDWTDWFAYTTQTSASYPAIGGETYAFRVRGRDFAYNVEDWTTPYDTATTIESTPPQTAVLPLPPYFRLDMNPIINWNGSDPGNSGITGFDVQYSIGNGNWVNWQTGTTETAAVLSTSAAGQTYSFRSRADDQAQNAESWPNHEDTETSFYIWGITGSAHDNTGTPVENLSIVTSPGAFITSHSNQEGIYSSYVANIAGTYNVDFAKDGYDDLPETSFDAIADAYLAVVMPPADNIVANWGFESGSLSPEWTTGGTVTPTVSNTSHTGDYAVYLGQSTGSFVPPLQLSEGSDAANNPDIATDANGTLHVVWVDASLTITTSDSLQYAQRTIDGAWSEPQVIPGASNYPGPPNLVVDNSGNVHIAWTQSGNIYYTQRNYSGSWLSPQMVSNDGNSFSRPKMIVDDDGRVHFSWNTWSEAYYRRRESNGTWTAIQNLSEWDISSSPQLVVNHQGVIHALWYKDDSSYGSIPGIFYTQSLDGVSWATPQRVLSTNISEFQVAIGKNNVIHLVWAGANGLYHRQRQTNGSWSLAAKIGNGLGFYGGLALAIGEDNLARLLWSEGQKLYFAQQDSNNIWSAPHNLSEIPGEGVLLPQLVIDAQGNSHVAWSGHQPTPGLLYYTSQQNGAWGTPENLANNPDGAFEPVLAVDTNGFVHLVFADTSVGLREVYYLGPETTEVESDSVVFQTITIPVTMTAPTLSFLHQLKGAMVGEGSALTVNIDDGIIVAELLNLKNYTGGWTHQWVDLTPWAGQTVSITFNLHQTSNAPVAYAYLDEITLGSAHPDIWVNVNATAVLPGEQTIHTLIYGNRGGAVSENTLITYTLPADISFVSASVPPTSSNGLVLVWDIGSLPAKSEPFTMVITGTVSAAAVPFESLISTAEIHATSELEILNNVAEGGTFIGRFLYLPAVFKQ